ncbi:hypothetical protein CYY_006704 [Polysphondylium violaceum]|uniref:UBC core domain-containing protein n=1 Tax=Polysphondylium violaceum TaxID=133409 RepID=A0A8J4PRV5_9MYCE|nr:hypothetical protein CYY_006704 [Polysphondylium violaceum]
MSGLALGRLTEERKTWRKDHPFGFNAKPATNKDGSMNLFLWNCSIPGKEGTAWQGGLYPVTIHFSEDYPSKSPLCSFPGKFFHPNVFENGQICLSILGNDWKPSISVKQILLGIQDLLDTPNPNSPAQTYAYELFVKQKDKYRTKVEEQAKRFPVLDEL